MPLSVFKSEFGKLHHFDHENHTAERGPPKKFLHKSIVSVSKCLHWTYSLKNKKQVLKKYSKWTNMPNNESFLEIIQPPLIFLSSRFCHCYFVFRAVNLKIVKKVCLVLPLLCCFSWIPKKKMFLAQALGSTVSR